MKKLTRIADHLKQSEAFYFTSAARVPEGRWLEAPAKGGWSAGEISAHVAMIEERILSRIAKTLEKPPVFVPLWKQFHLPVWLAASRGRRVQSPIPLDPAMVVEKRASLARVSTARIATLAFMECCVVRDLGKYRLPHPFMGSFTIYDWLFFIGFHQERHAKQILQFVETFHS